MNKLFSFLKHYKELSTLDLFRKVIFRVLDIIDFRFFRKARCLVFFKSARIILGKNVSLIGYSNNLKIGSDINVYNNCIFELGSASNLEIGNKVIFSYGCIICVTKSLKIGDNVQIGEYSSIRDTTHDYTDFGQPMMLNQDLSKSIVIGNNVWIGKNCLIMPGSVIEDGVVVGANSLVNGTLKKDIIYAGNPIKEIKKRPSHLI